MRKTFTQSYELLIAGAVGLIVATPGILFVVIELTLLGKLIYYTALWAWSLF